MEGGANARSIYRQEPAPSDYARTGLIDLQFLGVQRSCHVANAGAGEEDRAPLDRRICLIAIKPKPVHDQPTTVGVENVIARDRLRASPRRSELVHQPVFPLPTHGEKRGPIYHRASPGREELADSWAIEGGGFHQQHANATGGETCGHLTAGGAGADHRPIESSSRRQRSPLRMRYARVALRFNQRFRRA